MKVTLEFFKIPQKDKEYLEKAIDETEYERVLNDMITELKDGNYTVA
jgi:hypothetical protein